MSSTDSILQATDINIHLWKRFKAGDSDALGQLAQVHYRALYNYATRFSSDPDFIRDSIQDMYLELWERRKNLSETHFVKSYLLKALRHKLIKESIRLKRFQEPQSDFFGDDDTDPSIEAHIIEDENLRYQNGRLKQIITLLSKRQQEIIYLRFYQNLDNENIANIMGLGRQSVSNLLSRTLKDIKEIWVPVEFVLVLSLAFFCEM
ncbi:RNA polymerase sigma factor [Dyadobacter sp. CY323]|uniref:RNA polymerase sigma factor n=1 Tax=Dyadobacter sp. CY323 TaxID=2907302 RepID=UPI001F158EB7|nr:sigma-70 family RNA polymerase sigma factor [Dyadobacter sp. CY323]MCE6989930.1 sigma-70 family RNA polymerase sigma factor [Dyadobacter sp. CY323]